jgi:hypothetical protein
MDLEISFDYINGFLKTKCDMFIINVDHVLEFLDHMAIGFVPKISKNLPASIFRSLDYRKMVRQTHMARNLLLLLHVRNTLYIVLHSSTVLLLIRPVTTFISPVVLAFSFQLNHTSTGHRVVHSLRQNEGMLCSDKPVGSVMNVQITQKVQNFMSSWESYKNDCSSMELVSWLVS